MGKQNSEYFSRVCLMALGIFIRQIGLACGSESYKSAKWASNTNGYNLRHVQVSKRFCDVICIKEY